MSTLITTSIDTFGTEPTENGRCSGDNRDNNSESLEYSLSISESSNPVGSEIEKTGSIMQSLESSESRFDQTRAFAELVTTGPELKVVADEDGEFGDLPPKAVECETFGDGEGGSVLGALKSDLGRKKKSMPLLNGPPASPTTPSQTEMSTRSDPTRQFNPIGDAKDPLPTPWERRVDPSGSTYHVHHDTCQTTRHRPTAKVHINGEMAIEYIETGKIWWRRWIVDWWALEILSMILGFTCLAIVLGTLIHFEGKEVSTWRNGFTLDMFISLFSGLAKSFLLFPTAEALGQLKWVWFTTPHRLHDFEVLDNASRGVWGSFTLLARSKRITMPSVGAAIIVGFSLPLGLLSQLLIQYTVVLAAVGISSISRVVQFSSMMDPYSNDVENKWGGQSALLAAAKPLLYSTSAPRIQPYVSCTTNHCSWGPFNTIGLCSECASLNVSEIFRFGCNTVLDDWRASTVSTKANLHNTTVETCGYYFYPATGLPILMSGYAFDSSGRISEGLGGRMLNLFDYTTQQTLIPNGTIQFPHVANPLVDFLLSLTDGGPAGAMTNNTLSIWECVSSLCVQTLNSTISGSLLSENLTDFHTMELEYASRPWSSPVNSEANYILTLPGQNSQNETFSVDSAAAKSIYQTYGFFIPSSLVASSANSSISLKLNWEAPRVIELPSASNPWNSANGASQILRITDAMSTTMRNQQLDTRSDLDMVTGVAFGQKIRVYVNWTGILVPGTLALLTAMTFVITTIVISSREKRVGIWKNSAIATLFNGIPKSILQDLKSKSKASDAMEKVEGMMVRLEDE